MDTTFIESQSGQFLLTVAILLFVTISALVLQKALQRRHHHEEHSHEHPENRDLEKQPTVSAELTAPSHTATHPAPDELVRHHSAETRPTALRTPAIDPDALDRRHSAASLPSDAETTTRYPPPAARRESRTE